MVFCLVSKQAADLFGQKPGPNGAASDLRSVKTDCDHILAIRAFEGQFIARIPGVPAPELHDTQIWKYIMIKKAAQPTRVPATDLKRISGLMSGTAMTLD
jgi:hypothetical protein